MDPCRLSAGMPLAFASSSLISGMPIFSVLSSAALSTSVSCNGGRGPASGIGCQSFAAWTMHLWLSRPCEYSLARARRMLSRSLPRRLADWQEASGLMADTRPHKVSCGPSSRKCLMPRCSMIPLTHGSQFTVCSSRSIMAEHMPS